MNPVPVKWAFPDRLLSTEEGAAYGFTSQRLSAIGRVPVVELAALRVALCPFCKKGLPYRKGFHSGHVKSRDYFKACEADTSLGENPS